MGISPFITYGLDIEIDPRAGVVDPATVPIRAIGLSSDRIDHLLEGDEAQMLRDLDEVLRIAEPGVVATWNGSIFDLPYLADRARIRNVSLDLTLVEEPVRSRRRRPLPGHRGPYLAMWGHHRHLDTYRLYGDATPPTTWSKLLGRGHNRGIVADSDDLVNEALNAHARTDAHLARMLTERRGLTALRAADQLETVDPAHVPTTRTGRAPIGLPPAVVGA